MKRRRMQANASARRCTTVALSVLLAPQVPGLVFCLFYKHLGFPSPCRAPPAKGCFRRLLRGSQKSFLGSFLKSFLGSFWTQLELSSHVFDYMTLEWLNELTHSWTMDILHVSHLHFHILHIFSHFLRSLHWPFCIVWFAGGGPSGWRKARFARARREVKLENFACKI